MAASRWPLCRTIHVFDTKCIALFYEFHTFPQKSRSVFPTNCLNTVCSASRVQSRYLSTSARSCVCNRAETASRRRPMTRCCHSYEFSIQIHNGNVTFRAATSGDASRGNVVVLALLADNGPCAQAILELQIQRIGAVYDLNAVTSANCGRWILSFESLFFTLSSCFPKEAARPT